MAEFREGIGLPPLRLSERGRQMSAFFSTLLGLSAGQLGLLICLTPLAELAGLELKLNQPSEIDHTPLLAYWPDGSTVSFAGGATVLPLGSARLEQAVLGAAAVVGSALGVVFSVLSRSHHRELRRRAIMWGYLYVVAEIIISGLVVGRAILGQHRAIEPDLERQYHTAFANAMWDYLYDPQLKVYLDTVQQGLGCCGAGGFTDWYLTDWLRPSVYKQRYYMNLLGRLKFGLRPNESYYSLRNYGSLIAQQALVAQLNDSEATSSKQVDLFFNEVPFSCCDPDSPIFCRQQFANRAMFAYDPSENLTLFDRGCASALAESIANETGATVAPLWWLFCVKLAALALYRLVQTSQACALGAGRHLSPARGWVVLLRPSRGSGGLSEPGSDSQPLMEEGEAGGGTDSTTGAESTEEDTEGTADTAGGESGGGDTEDMAEADNIPPPPPMD